MTKAEKTARQRQAENKDAVKLPSPFEFREAVKYALINDHGMPALFADEVLDNDAEFVERQRQSASTGEGAVARTADGLRFEPPSGLKWVALSEGERVASKEHIVIELNDALGSYLDSLVTLGLHGVDRDAVARTMLARGVESVLPMLATSQSKGQPRK